MDSVQCSDDDEYNLDNIAANTAIATSPSASQDINVSVNYQLWTWWRPRGGDIISSLIPRLMTVRSEESETNKDEVDTVPAPVPLIGAKDPVGMGQDMEKLGQWMIGSSEDGNRVRCILGVGGVGKTTVATALYRKYGDRFDLRVMVTASQLSSSGGAAVIRSIHDQVMPQKQQLRPGGDGAEIDDGAVQTCCFNGLKRRHGFGSITLQDNSTVTEQADEVLRKKSCLLLIDDVRSEKTWREISHVLLPQHLPKQSRVIITTRSPAVAAACDENGSTHKMAGILTKQNSREIFLEALSESRNGRKDADHRKSIPPSRLWEMCMNHPVAITAMAGHVAYNPDKSAEEWKQVCSNLLPDSAEAITRDGVPRILRHCYHDMPAEIKTCFLYLSMYPKGRKISRKHLTRRWLAEGFIVDKPGKSIEEVADDYFDQLIRRKMLHAVEQSSNGKVRNCKVYGVVHDFIVSMAREENLVTVIGGGSYLLPPSGGKVRRMSLSLPANGGHESSAAQSLNMSHVRSLAVFEEEGGENGIASSPQPALISPNSPILQVIDLEGCNGQVDMSVLCSMLLLKYISLRRTDTKSLPREIGKLSRLETLDVRETNITQLPDTVWHLECLVCILGGDKTTRKSLKLPANNTKKKATMRSSLRVLSGIEITDESLKHCEHLTKLRKLSIYKISMKKSITSLETWIARLGNNYLHTLIVISTDKQSLIVVQNSSFNQLTALDLSGGSIPAELPEWIKQLGVLTKLTLPMTLLRSDTLNDLRRMSSLFSLTFLLTAHTPPVAGRDEVFAIVERNKADSDGEIVFPAGGFTRLQLLRFSGPFIPPLSFLDTAMPNLERLELRSRSLEGLFGIENLKKLKEVHLNVHVGADQFTRSLVDNIAAAASQHYAGTRIIREEYQD